MKYAKILGVIFTGLGLFLIIIFMPLWCWIVLTGLSFIALGLTIIFLSR